MVDTTGNKTLALAASPAWAHGCGVAGRALLMLAVGLTCALAWRSADTSAVQVPWLLAGAGLTLWPAARNATLGRLQAVIALYLCCVPASAVMNSYGELTIAGRQVAVSHILLVLALCAAGYAGCRLSPQAKDERGLESLPAWTLAMGILALHMAVLAGLLNVYYGFGFDRSLIALGYVGTACLLCLTWRKLLGHRWWQRGLATVLVIYYALTAWRGN